MPPSLNLNNRMSGTINHYDFGYVIAYLTGLNIRLSGSGTQQIGWVWKNDKRLCVAISGLGYVRSEKKTKGGGKERAGK